MGTPPFCRILRAPLWSFPAPILVEDMGAWKHSHRGGIINRCETDRTLLTSKFLRLSQTDHLFGTNIWILRFQRGPALQRAWSRNSAFWGRQGLRLNCRLALVNLARSRRKTATLRTLISLAATSWFRGKRRPLPSSLPTGACGRTHRLSLPDGSWSAAPGYLLAALHPSCQEPPFYSAEMGTPPFCRILRAPLWSFPAPILVEDMGAWKHSHRGGIINRCETDRTLLTSKFLRLSQTDHLFGTNIWILRFQRGPALQRAWSRNSAFWGRQGLRLNCRLALVNLARSRRKTATLRTLISLAATSWFRGKRRPLPSSLPTGACGRTHRLSSPDSSWSAAPGYLLAALHPSCQEPPFYSAEMGTPPFCRNQSQAKSFVARLPVDQMLFRTELHKVCVFFRLGSIGAAANLPAKHRWANSGGSGFLPTCFHLSAPTIKRWRQRILQTTWPSPQFLPEHQGPSLRWAPCLSVETVWEHAAAICSLEI